MSLSSRSLSATSHPSHRACGAVGKECMYILEKWLPDSATAPAQLHGCPWPLRVRSKNPDQPPFLAQVLGEGGSTWSASPQPVLSPPLCSAWPNAAPTLALQNTRPRPPKAGLCSHPVPAGTWHLPEAPGGGEDSHESHSGRQQPQDSRSHALCDLCDQGSRTKILKWVSWRAPQNH